MALRRPRASEVASSGTLRVRRSGRPVLVARGHGHRADYGDSGAVGIYWPACRQRLGLIGMLVIKRNREML